MYKDREEASIEFLKTELLPEAVHDRCFCEAGSREFVELVSTVVEPLGCSASKISPKEGGTEYYRARLMINFSGEAKIFGLIIKLLADGEKGEEGGYAKFMNEELFYSKMTKKYQLDIYPKCYVADMGRYGRPVIVLEDLEACGYVGVDSGKLDEYHLGLCLKAIARFHRRGLALKAENFNSFREFHAKLIESTRLNGELSEDLGGERESSNRILKILKKVRYEGPPEIESEESPDSVTICHGRLALGTRFFFFYENGKPVDVRVIGWNAMRYRSIAFDLAQILRDNLAREDLLERLLLVYAEAANNTAKLMPAS